MLMLRLIKPLRWHRSASKVAFNCLYTDCLMRLRGGINACLVWLLNWVLHAFTWLFVPNKQSLYILDLFLFFIIWFMILLTSIMAWEEYLPPPCNLYKCIRWRFNANQRPAVLLPDPHTVWLQPAWRWDALGWNTRFGIQAQWLGAQWLNL